MKMRIETALLIVGLIALGCADVFAREPIPVILDTDIGNDVDDVLAARPGVLLERHRDPDP